MTNFQISMKEVDIYDISSGTWYTQTTTGDPKTTDGDVNGFPKPRMIGCAVAASAPDSSSHHIYMYGGGGTYLGDSFDEVWVLSLPMFRWTKVYDGPLGVFGNTCHLTGKRYMLSVGGYREEAVCGTLLWIFDASELKWVDDYSPNEAYYVSVQIVSVVGGTSQGGSTVKSPEGGWGTNVEAVFHSTSNKTNRSAILGGALGGLLGAAAVLSALLFLLRTRRLREGASHHSDSADTGSDLPEFYDGGSTWNPPPHGMYAPSPRYELGDCVTPELGGGMTPELGEGMTPELGEGGAA